MSSVTDFLDMGGYGFYIWFTYAAALIIFVVFFVSSGRSLTTVKAQIKRYIRRTES